MEQPDFSPNQTQGPLVPAAATYNYVTENNHSVPLSDKKKMAPIYKLIRFCLMSD